MRKKLVLAVSVLLLTGIVSAEEEWTIEEVEKPEFATLGMEGNNHVGLINLTYYDTESETLFDVRRDVLEEDWAVEYEYGDQTREMDWFGDGIWYADFELNQDDEITYIAYGETNELRITDQWPPVSLNETISGSSIQIELFEPDRLKTLQPEDETTIEANVTANLTEREWIYFDHTDSVQGVAVDDNGNVYSASQDYEVHKIDSNGDKDWEYSGHSDFVRSVAVDSNGNVYSGSRDNEVHKIDSSGDQVWNYTGHSDDVVSIAVDGDGNVYTGSLDNEVHKLNLSDAPDDGSSFDSKNWSYTGPGNVISVAVDGYDNIYASSSDEVHKLNLSDAPDDGSSFDSKNWSYTGHSNFVHSVAVDSNGNVYTGSSDNEVHKLDLSNAPSDGSSFSDSEWEYTGHSGSVSSVAVDSEKNVYTGSIDGTVHKIDSSGRQVWNYTGHSDWVRGVTIDSEGNVYTGSDDNEVHKLSDQEEDFLEPDSFKYYLWNETDHDIESGNFNILVDDMKFDRDIEIPDVDNGLFLTLVAEHDTDDFSGFTGSSTFVLDFDETGDIFGVEDLNFTAGFSGNHVYDIEVENFLHTDRIIETNVTGDITDIIDIQDSFDLNATDSRNVSAEFEIEEIDDYSGEITFNDTEADFNQTIEVDIFRPAYDVRNDGMAVFTGSGDWLNTTVEGGIYETEVDLYYLDENLTHVNDTVEVETEVTGDIEDHLDIESSFEMNNSVFVNLFYEPLAPGNFTGEVIFETENHSVGFNTSLESNIEAEEPDISVQEDINLGQLNEGDQVTVDLEVENTGDIGITGLEADSNDYAVEVDSVSIDTGETVTVDLTFSDILEDSGTVDIIGENPVEDVSSSVTIAADVIPNYASMADELSARISNIEAQTDDETLLNELNELQIDTEEIRSEYNQENYGEAENMYNRVSSDIEQIEQQVTGAGNGVTTDGNGLPFVPIIAGLLIILLIAILGYLSLIPEEGDPLYGVLGE